MLLAYNNLSKEDNDFSCKPPMEYAERFLENFNRVFRVTRT